MGKKQLKKEAVVDTRVYEVETIVDSRLLDGCLSYYVKWVGYTNEYDTYEPEMRLNCNSKLLSFLVTLLGAEDYTPLIEKTLANLRSCINLKDFLKVIDPLAFLVSTTFFTGTVKFVNSDATNVRFQCLEYVRDYNQTHLLYAAMLPSRDVLEKSHEKYSEQLRYRQEVFTDYPFVRIIFPFHYDTVLYAPPPLSSLLFEPVTEQMMKDQVEHLFVKKSENTSFNNVKVNIDDSYFECEDLFQDPRFAPFMNIGFETPEERNIKGMARHDNSFSSRFLATLELVQEPARGWILRAGHDIEVDSPLVLMTGVLCPVAEAHKSLIAEGEQVAFSSFIEVPGTKMCLDRREFYDFSKFIAHSCNPTCAVRLVNSGNEIPDLVVYNLVPLDDKNNREITIDYFQGFVADVRQYFRVNKPKDGMIFDLYDKTIDFVQCQCGLEECREVLYIDKSTLAEDTKKTKTDKLKSLEQGFFFPGLQLAESNRVWGILNGKFEE